ncbi:MAG: hypothetical protein AB1Z98_34240 [Nannocystaceae bacterium]
MRLRPLLLLLASTSACFDPADSGDETTTGSGTATDPGTDSSGSVTPTTDDSSTTSTVDDTGTDTDGCAQDCDDGIACTEDACVDGACVNTPMDALCDDGIECTADACDAATGCTNAPMDAMCDDGVDCTADACDPEAGCTAAPDDGLCDDGVGCTADVCDPVAGCSAVPDDAACDDGVACTTETCDPTLDCMALETTVLVFNGSNGGSTAPEDAVASFGYTPIVVTSAAEFDAAFDAGGLAAIVFDVPSVFGTVPAPTQMRLDMWIAGGGRLIFGFWNLDADPLMASTLDVSVLESVDPTLPIFPDPASPVALFAAPETIPAPIIYADVFGDNGDQLVLDGAGFIAGRFNDPVGGPGAILVTHGDRVITNGFVISEIGADTVDVDIDGINDGEELLRNEIDFVCATP